MLSSRQGSEECTRPQRGVEGDQITPPSADLRNGKDIPDRPDAKGTTNTDIWVIVEDIWELGNEGEN